MCVSVDDPWEVAWSDPHAVLASDEKGYCYECGRDLVGVEHTHEAVGPIAWRECEIEGCDHEECDDAFEYVDVEGQGAILRTCHQCLAARVWLERVCRSWLYGGVIEDLERHFVEEMRPISSLPLGRLVVAARRKWRRFDGTTWDPDVVRSWAQQGADFTLRALAGPSQPITQPESR